MIHRDFPVSQLIPARSPAAFLPVSGIPKGLRKDPVRFRKLRKGSRQIRKAPKGIPSDSESSERDCKTLWAPLSGGPKLRKGSRQIRLLHFPATDPPKGWGFRALNQPTRMLDSNWGPGPPKMAKAGFRKFPGPLSAPPWIPKCSPADSGDPETLPGRFVSRPGPPERPGDQGVERPIQK